MAVRSIVIQNPLRKWSEVHSSIFSSFVNLLEQNNIRYFILRNYELLPSGNNSKDIDVIIEPGQYKKSALLLLSVFREHKLSNYYVARFERVRCWFGMDLDNNFSIQIDLIEGYLNKGFEIYSFDELYSNTVYYNGFKVLNERFDAIMLLLYKVIGSKELKDKYRKKIQFIYSKESKEINNALQKILGLQVSKLIIELLERSDFESIITQSKIISHKSKKRAFIKRPLTTTKNLFLFLIEKTYRIIWCPSKYKKFIAVIAPDGAGKTTFINGLAEELSFMFVTDLEKISLFHFRPTILPNLGEIREKVGLKDQDKDFTKPHRNKPANFLSSFGRMIYYWCDYMVGIFILIRKDVQFDKFTIFDRYIYDFIVDPLRSRINLPKFIRVFFAKSAPQPQIVFVLIANPEIIYNRKQELTLSELDRQLDELKKLVNSNNRFIRLDASLDPTEIIHQGTKIIIDRYTKVIK